MSVACIGISHHTAPVALRERLALTSDEQRQFLLAASADAAAAGVGGMVLLSTCNRTELYAATTSPARAFVCVPAVLPRLLAGWRRVNPADLTTHLRNRLGADAVRHLCRVAAGLDSMIVGECEVLGQVAAAHELAAREQAAGPVLDAAFQAAVRAGRRARSETGIGRRAASISMTAVRRLSAIRGGLHAARILIIGTGPAARLAGAEIGRQGGRLISVVGRTAGHADELARALDAAPLPWHALEAAIRGADVIVSCTGAPHAVITRELVASALAGRRGRRALLIADIAVPRDVEPSVRSLPGLTVLDVDDLQRSIAVNLESRRREAPAVEAIVDQEVARFEAWCRGAALRPMLAAMRERGEAIRRREVDRALRRLGPAGDALRQQLDAVTRSLVAKLLHEPTQRLRDEADSGKREAAARAIAELFGLEPSGEHDEAGNVA